MTTDDADRAILRRVPLFAELSEEDLTWITGGGEAVELAAGELLASEGEPGDALFVIVSGELQVVKRSRTTDVPIAVLGPGEIVGEMAIFEAQPRMASVRAASPARVIRIPRDEILELLRTRPSATLSMLRTVMGRLRSTEAMLREREKLAALGTLSAGLAHELNNPVSAIERSAALLIDRLADAELATRALGAARLTDRQLAAVDEVRASCLATQAPGVLSPIQQAERENAIGDWLAAHGLSEAITGPLAETSVTIDALDRIAAVVDRPALDAALRSAAGGCSVRAIASEIQDAAMRISGLVMAIKGFTQMDQATVAGAVDLRVSLGNTIAVLRSKARSKSAEVVVQIEPDLPPVRGFAGELNQIWANLIDNALDAVADGGRVEVAAARERQRVVVRVADNGGGIPDEVRAHLFEPFFTTKPIGKGTGLGLDIVRRLVSHNDGDIDVESRPGRTEFRVSLPITDAEGAGGRA